MLGTVPGIPIYSPLDLGVCFISGLTGVKNKT